MKITTLLLIVTLLQVSAASRAQKISLSESRAPLTKVLREIRSQSGFNLVYTEEMLKDAKAVSIRVKDAEMRAVLDEVFREQPLSYTIVNNAIVLKEKETSLLDRIRAAWVAVDVNGRVVDEQGQPLPGATVKVKDGSQATTTDARGEFTLRQVQPDATLVVSFIGFQQLEVKAAADMGNIVMKVAESQLDQVQVIAYGTTSKRLSTSNIGGIKAKDIEKQPVTNPLLALQGRVPGIIIEQSTGLPNSGVKVRIQGQNSIGNGNDPLYVIDGMPYSSQLLPSINDGLLGRSGANSGGNPLSFINSADIESIDVLKDADATAIYGSRGANGVVLITTKKGKPGETRVNFNLQQGFGQIANKLDLLNTQQYLEMRHEALKNDRMTAPGAGDYDLNGLWDTTRYTDWQKELIGRTASYSNAQVSISGGSENTQFLIGAGYHRETGVFPGDFSDQKGNVNFNINNTSSNKKFNIRFSGSYLTDLNELPNTDLTAEAVKLAPLAPSIYNNDGSLNWMPNASGTRTWDNPLRYSLTEYENKTQNLISNLSVGYKLTRDLELSTGFGYNYIQAREISTIPFTSFSPREQLTEQRSSTFGTNRVTSFNIEPQLEFHHSFGQSSIEALVGTTLQNSYSNREQFVGTGYSSDLVIKNISAAATVRADPAYKSIYKYNAVFTRVNYNLNNKYILNFTARRDGSSRFGSENQFHNFGAIGAAWIFSEEHFIKGLIPALSFGKLRGSFGTTGNDQIGDYNYLSSYNTVANIGVPYQGIPVIQPTRLTNPYLQWEETKKLQLGIDLGFLKDRLLFNATYYTNRSSNQLLTYGLPYLAGFTGVARNFPATVQNTGLELSLTSNNVQNNDFKWESSFNITLPKTKLVEFPNLEQSSYYNSLFIGQPINIATVFQFAGVDSQTGLFQFLSANGTLTSSPDYSHDNTQIINLDPKFYGGFQNTFSFKGIQLDIMLQFVKQTGLNDNEFGFTRQGNFNAGWSNQPVEILNRWQKPDDIKFYQKFSPRGAGVSTAWNSVRSSDASYTDASFLRVKNVSISYVIPKRFTQKLGINALRTFVNGQNLATFTKFKGLDPETRSSQVLPPLRVVTLGLSVTL